MAVRIDASNKKRKAITVVKAMMNKAARLSVKKRPSTVSSKRRVSFVRVGTAL